MSRWMIDDLGNIRPAGAPALAEVLGVPTPTSAPELARLEDFGILNVGLIFVETQPDGIGIRCRPAMLSQRAFATLSYWLLDHAKAPVTIAWYDQAWGTEHAPDARTAISFVSYLLELRGGPPQPTKRICAQPSVQAARTWQRFKAEAATLTARRLDQEQYGRILDPLFHGRWTVFDVATDTSAVEVAASGVGYPCLDPAFMQSEGRRRFETLTDQGYRAWLTAGYLEVARSGRPRFENVDAIVAWPRIGDLRTRYWRIVVPLYSTPERCLILSASGNDSGIDLRPKPLEEISQIERGVGPRHP
jgi:hypothetical protein